MRPIVKVGSSTPPSTTTSSSTATSTTPSVTQAGSRTSLLGAGGASGGGDGLPPSRPEDHGRRQMQASGGGGDTVWTQLCAEPPGGPVGSQGEDLPTGDGVIRYDFTMGSPSGKKEDNLQCTAYGFDEDMPSGINDLGGLGQIFTDTHSGSSSGPPTEFYHLHQETPEGGKVKITVLGRPGGNSGLSDSGTSSDSDSDSDSNRNQGDNGSPPIVRRRSFFRD